MKTIKGAAEIPSAEHLNEVDPLLSILREMETPDGPRVQSDDVLLIRLCSEFSLHSLYKSKEKEAFARESLRKAIKSYERFQNYFRLLDGRLKSILNASSDVVYFSEEISGDSSIVRPPQHRGYDALFSEIKEELCKLEKLVEATPGSGGKPNAEQTANALAELWQRLRPNQEPKVLWKGGNEGEFPNIVRSTFELLGINAEAYNYAAKARDRLRDATASKKS